MRLWLIVALALLGALRAHVMRPLQSLLHRDSEASQRPHEINRADMCVLINTINRYLCRHEVPLPAVSGKEIVLDGQPLDHLINPRKRRNELHQPARAKHDRSHSLGEMVWTGSRRGNTEEKVNACLVDRSCDGVRRLEGLNRARTRCVGCRPGGPAGRGVSEGGFATACSYFPV